MRSMKLALLVLLACAGTLAAETASAHGGARVHFGIGIGFPGYWPGYYYPPYYPAYYPPYYPQVPAAPPVYIEQGVPQAAPSQAPAPGQSSGWWYYCAESQMYYPYAKQCPSGWQRVTPQPAS